MHRTLILVFAAALSIVLSARTSDQTHEQKLQQAIDFIESKGDLVHAIPLLEDVAKSSDKALAARALLYLAQAQERQGQAAARKTYERIVAEFSAQTEIAAQARVRLSALSGGAQSTRLANASGIVWQPPTLGLDPLKVSPDGRFIVYENTNLFLHDIATGRERQLTTLTQDEDVEDAEIAFSPDGRWMAYECLLPKQGLEEIRLVDLRSAGIAASRILLKAPDIESVFPFDWSSDSRWIAAEINRKGGTHELALVSSTDGAVRVLRSVPIGFIDAARFSPNAEHLAFSSRDTSSANHDIFIVAVAGGAPRPVVTGRNDERVVGWSADGACLLFTSDRSGSTDLWSQAISDGKAVSNAEPVRRDIGRINVLGIATANRVFYAKISRPPGTDIKIAKIDFNEGTVEQAPADLTGENRTLLMNPSWSPDGSQLAYISGGPTNGTVPVLVIRPVANPQATHELRPQLERFDGRPMQWSPDGKFLIVSGAESFAKRGLFKIDVSTGETALLVANEGTAGQNMGINAPQVIGWSTDGRQVFLNRLVPESERLVVRDVTTGAERELLKSSRENQHFLDPQIASGFNKLYYRRAIPATGRAPFANSAFVRNVTLIERTMDSGAEREIAQGMFWRLFLSHDERLIATNRVDNSTKKASIVVLSTTTGELTTVMQVELPEAAVNGSTNPFVIQPVAWARDDRSLLISKILGPGVSELWWAPLDGRSPHKIDIQPLRGIQMHPDGHRIVGVVTDPRAAPQPAAVLVLENFLPAAPAKKSSR